MPIWNITAHRMPVNAASVRGLVSDIVPPPHPVKYTLQYPVPVLLQLLCDYASAKFDPGAQSPSSILVHLGCSHTGIQIAKFDPGAPGLQLFNKLQQYCNTIALLWSAVRKQKPIPAMLAVSAQMPDQCPPAEQINTQTHPPRSKLCLCRLL